MLRNLTNHPRVCLRVNTADYYNGRVATPLLVQSLKDYRNWFNCLNAMDLTKNVTQCFPLDLPLLQYLEEPNDMPSETFGFFLPDLKLMLTQVFNHGDSYRVKHDVPSRSTIRDGFWLIDYADIVRIEDFHTSGMLLERNRVVDGASLTTEFVYLHWNHVTSANRCADWGECIKGTRFVTLTRDMLKEKLVPFFNVVNGEQTTGFYRVYQLKEDLIYDNFFSLFSENVEEMDHSLNWLFTHYQIASRTMYCDFVAE